MSGKEGRENCQTPVHSIIAEFQCPVSFVDRLLQENQHSQCLNLSSPDFLLAMLDYLTDYILELIGHEVNSGFQLIARDMAGLGSNGEPHYLLKDAAFSLFDETPGSRRTG
ncbi:huntingtin-interacting protein M [Talpa occidentalis]|uniref:huntingtin-interacting protein M n=1 Tax=Talpa occidentalis TaxID=50954 RepID=UPI00188F417D|nr:huntingtin-interacting protein M [Talpa occidentalis]